MSDWTITEASSASQVLRPLEPADLDALLVLQTNGAVAGLGHIFPQDRYPFPALAVRRRWEREITDPGIDCFAVLDDVGALAGFAATRGDQFLHFGTAVATWGTGLAALAHDQVVAHLIGQGFPLAWLRVFEGNARARRFYERRGWAATVERSESAFEPHPVLLRYRLPLRAPERLKKRFSGSGPRRFWGAGYLDRLRRPRAKDIVHQSRAEHQLPQTRVGPASAVTLLSATTGDRTRALASLTAADPDGRACTASKEVSPAVQLDSGTVLPMTATHPGTLLLLCGPPCSGKTTLAKRLAARRRAVRLSPDEWVADLGLAQHNDLRGNVYPLQWELAQQIVLSGANAVIESGHWMRAERDTKRSWARDHGVRVELHYLDVPLATLLERARRRTELGAPGTYPLTDDDLLHWRSVFEPPTQAERDLFDIPPPD